MRKIILFCFMVFTFVSGNNACAGMLGVPGVLGIPANTSGYIRDSAGCSVPVDITNGYKHPYTSLNWCTFNQSVSWADDVFVPTQSNHRWTLMVGIGYNPFTGPPGIYISSRNELTFAPNRTIGAQNPNWGGSTQQTVNTMGSTSLCYMLRDENAGKVYVGKEGPWCIGSYPPLPPTPSVDTCSINNDNPVTVDMGEINRADISTTAGSGELKHKSIPVWCNSPAGNATMPVNLQFNYTPTTFAAGKAIQSSVPGVGISVGYDSKILVSNEVLNLNLPTGDSNMDFTFEAIRDSSVAVADIETGPFTASGVLIMSLP